MKRGIRHRRSGASQERPVSRSAGSAHIESVPSVLNLLLPSSHRKGPQPAQRYVRIAPSINYAIDHEKSLVDESLRVGKQRFLDIPRGTAFPGLRNPEGSTYEYTRTSQTAPVRGGRLAQRLQIEPSGDTYDASLPIHTRGGPPKA